MSPLFRKHNIASFLFSLVLAPALFAQTPPPNADILKMIQAGLPEGVIIDKITAGTGHWDTSVDALIALKTAGATPAEMKAMTTPLAAAPTPTAAPQPVYVAGGLLRKTAAGDPYIQFAEKNPTLFPDGTHSNQAFLVSYEGKPAIRIPAEHAAIGNFRAGNLIITPTTLLFNPYLLEWKYGWYPKNARYEMKGNAAKEIMESAFSMSNKDVLITYKKIQYEAAFEDRTTSFSKKGHDFNVGFHYTGYPSTWTVGTVLCEPTENCNSPQLEQLVHDLTRDFAGTIAPLLAAAGISDVDNQLSPAAHYHLITADEFPKYAAIYQAQLDTTPAPTQHSGGGLAAFAELTQIAAAGAGAVAQSQAGGGTVAAQNNAMAQYNQNVATIEAGGTAAPYVPPTPVPTTTPPVTPTPKPAGKSGFKIDTKKSGGSVTGGNSGTAAPPVFYQPPPSTTGTVVAAICPANGFVPGLFISYGDAATAVPCTPGQPINRTTSTPTTSTSSFQAISPVFNCVTQSYVHDDLTFTNTCNQPLYVTWWIGGHSGSWTIDPGTSNGTGYTGADVAAGGGDTFYVCPQNASPVDASGHVLTGSASNYTCKAF